MSSLNLLQYSKELVNINEIRVWQMLLQYLSTADASDLCTCEICLVDIVALTLNRIPSQYQTEKTFTVAEQKVPDKEIYKHLRSSIDQVKTKPHH